MLSDAGVDVLVMDVTNAVRYWKQWDVLFSTMQKMKEEGNNVPKFCFWAFNGPVITVVQDLYEKVYKEDKYKDLWFYWDGKPLILLNGEPALDANGGGVLNPNPNYDEKAATDKNHPYYNNPDYSEKFYKDYTKDIYNFFTIRTMWWGYYEWGGKLSVGTPGNWIFGYDSVDERVAAMNPYSLVSRNKGRREQVAVSHAQHPISIVGKCWTRETTVPA